MLLAHRPVLPPMSPPSAHRRHPSAPPAVVVQPTKVPGILSIAKPLRADSPRQHQSQSHNRHQRTPKPRHSQSHSRTPQPSQDDSGKLAHGKPSDVTLPTLLEKQSAQPPADKSRGRQTKTPDKRATRSSSTHGHSRRNNVRQPSPPIPSSQVEGPTLSTAQSFAHRISNPAANSFDPFIISSDSDSDNARPFPSNSGLAKLPLAPPLSAKSPRRRHHTTQAPGTPSPVPRPVPVPRGKPTHRNNVSRSAPVPQVFFHSDKRRASAGHTMDFPVCDDTTDAEDNSYPSTPTREFLADATWHRLAFDGPCTAPLSSPNGFPFSYRTPSPPRHHQRTPSDGVFNMSFDEDVSLMTDTPEELQKLFTSPLKRFGSVGHNATRAANKDKAGFFASSVFQNSPSPDELPPPAF